MLKKEKKNQIAIHDYGLDVSKALLDRFFIPPR